MRDIHLSVLTPADLSQLSLAKLALSAILETHEDLRPKRIGNWEPLKQKADDHTTIDDFLGKLGAPVPLEPCQEVRRGDLPRWREPP